MKSIYSFFTSVLLLAGIGAFPTAWAQGDQTVQNVSVTPFNGAAEVMWDEVQDQEGVPASFYEISYGLYSVEEGLATEYDEVVDTDSSDVSFVLRDLTNGVRYYLAMKAVFSDGSKSPSFSSEVVVTPSSVYPDPAAEEEHGAAGDEEDTTPPVVESATALTQTLVKVLFSEPVTLPSVLPELSFTIAESLNSSVFVPVELVEYKTDYKGEGEKEVVHQDIVFVTLAEPVDVDTEYLLTVSAAVTDLAGNPVNSGVTDSAMFTGTDSTEIPTAEQPLVSSPAAEENNNEEPPAAEIDTVPPENVTDFVISSVPRLSDFLLNMRWKKSVSDDVARQNMYRSEDQGSSWQDETTLGKDAEEYSASGQPESELAFRITATDTAGNENSGTIESIRLPALPATGAPLALIAFGAAMSFAGLRRSRRKK